MAKAKPTRPKELTNTAEDIKKSLSFDAVVELIQSPWKLFWLNFKTGFVRGFAGVLGAAVAVVLIGFLVTIFGGLPYIGTLIKSIEHAVSGA